MKKFMSVLFVLIFVIAFSSTSFACHKYVPQKKYGCDHTFIPPNVKPPQQDIRNPGSCPWVDYGNNNPHNNQPGPGNVNNYWSPFGMFPGFF